MKIDVANDFTDEPYGRYRSNGREGDKRSAQAFREDILCIKLKEAIEKDKILTIDFTGLTVGLGSSFIEEIFGGLIRDGFSKEEILKHIEIKALFPYFERQAKKFIELEHVRLNKI